MSATVMRGRSGFAFARLHRQATEKCCRGSEAVVLDSRPMNRHAPTVRSHGNRERRGLWRTQELSHRSVCPLLKLRQKFVPPLHGVKNFRPTSVSLPRSMNGSVTGLLEIGNLDSESIAVLLGVVGRAHVPALWTSVDRDTTSEDIPSG